MAYAVPNYIARASTLLPNDPGFYLQWNLAGPTRHQHARRLGVRAGARRAGRRGAVVAVLDTGVAYERFGRFRRAPDLNRFVARLRLRRERQTPQRPERPRHARGGHDRAEHQQRDRGSGHRLPGEDHAGPCAGRRRRGRHRRDLARHPVRREAKGRGDQPQPRVRLLGALPRRSPTSSRRCATPASEGRAGGGGRRQPGRRRWWRIRRAPRRARRGRHHHPRLPGRVLQQRRRRGPDRARRRRRRRELGQPVRRARVPARPRRASSSIQQTFTSSVRRDSACRAATRAHRWRRRTCPAWRRW